MPAGLEKWKNLAGLIVSPNQKLAMIQFNALAKSVLAGDHKLQGEATSVVDFDAFMEWARPKVTWPIPPSFHEQILHMCAPILKMTNANKPFQWKWIDLPIPWMGGDEGMHDVFPLPVAILSERHRLHGQRCLMSASGLVHLMDIEDPVGRMFATDTRTRDRWAFWRDDLGIVESEVRPPPKSIAAKKRSKPLARHEDIAPMDVDGDPASDDTSSDEDPAEMPTFSQYMVTPKMFLGMLMWLCHLKRASVELQTALFSITRSMANWLPPQTTLPNGLAVAKSTKVPDISAWLHEHGMTSKWKTKDVTLPFPELFGETVGGEWLVWFAFRHWRKEPAALELCKDIVNHIGPVLDVAIDRRAHTSMPQVRLPAGTSESVAQVKKALRGDDKRFMAFNNFLARNVGWGKEDDVLLRNYVYDSKLKHYQSQILHALVAAYVVKVRSVLSTAMASKKRLLRRLCILGCQQSGQQGDSVGSCMDRRAIHLCTTSAPSRPNCNSHP